MGSWAVKIGMNIEAANYYMPSLAFGDLMIATLPNNPAGVTWNGLWPTFIPKGSFVTYIPSIRGYCRAGDYMLTIEGAGKLQLRLGNQKIYTFDGITNQPIIVPLPFNPKQGLLDILEVDPINPLKNVRLQCPGVDTSQLFHPDFIEMHKGFDTLRLMDWQKTNTSKEVEWIDRSTRVAESLESGIELCNTVTANAWVCIPHMASDDYVAQMARLVATKLNSKLKVYIEYSNEVWNWNFASSQYNLAQSKITGISYVAQYIRRSVQIQKIWAINNTTNKIVRIAAWQFANMFMLNGMFKQAIESEKARFDVYAVAPYVTPRGANFQLLNELLLAGREDAAKEAVFDICNWILKNQFEDYLKQWMDFGIAHGNAKLVAYEGGIGFVTDKEPMLTFLLKMHRDTKIASLLSRFLETLQPFMDMACYFTNISTYGKYGAWGARENIDDNSLKWVTLKNYMRQLNG